MSKVILLLLSLVLVTPAQAGSLTTVGGGHAASSGGGGSLPLDLIGTSATAAYDCYNKLRAAYAGNSCQIIRASDSTTIDIAFSGNVANLSPLTAFCNATTCELNKAYDQGPGGHDCTTLGIKPIVGFSVGSGINMHFTSGTTAPCEVTGLSIANTTIISAITSTANSGFNEVIAVTDGTNTYTQNEGSTGARINYTNRFVSGGNHNSSGNAFTDNVTVQATSTASASLAEEWQNGTADTPDTSTASFTATKIDLGSNGSTSYNGIISTAIIYPALSSGNSCTVGKAIAGFYSISTSGYGC